MPQKYDYQYFNVTFPAEFIAVVEINRPEKLNAFIEIMWLNLASIFNTLSHDPDVRVVLLTAAGDRAFSAGLDVQAAAASTLHPGTATEDGARAANRLRRTILEFQESVTAIERCEKPVIALLHGIAYGLAIELALAADIRLATPTARLSVKEVDIGLAADVGTLTRIVHAGVPLSWAKDAALTAREFRGDEALRVGLVSGGAGTKEELLRLGMERARVVAGKSPVAVVGTKAIVNYSRGRTVEEGLGFTAVWNAAYVQTGDVKEAILAGLQRRKVRFEKL